MSDRDFSVLMQMNVLLPAEMVNIAKNIGARAIVMTGSCAEYQKPARAHPVIESDPLQHDAPYGSTKAAGGICALSHSAVVGMPIAWMRIFNLFGAGELPHRLFPAALESIKEQKPIRMRAGHQVRDFLYVQDACEGLWAALQGLRGKTLPSGAYNLSTGQGMSVKEFIITLAACLDVDASDLRFDVSSLPDEESAYLIGNPALFYGVTGWKARFNVREGLQDALVTTYSC
jgi:nucleoside-diphosphate-sugar epimerase